MECRAGTILFGHYSEVDGGTVQIFLFSGSVVVGVVRLKWLGGVVRFFKSFSSLCCQLFWRAVVCGRAPFFYIDFSAWLYYYTFRGFVFYKLLILCYLLQMVEEEYGLGRL